MTTEVSSRTAGTVTSVLDAVVAEQPVGFLPVAVPLFDVDRRQLPEVLLHVAEGFPLLRRRSVRHEVRDRLTVAGDGEALPRLDPPHDLGVVVAELALGDGLRHDTIVALLSYTPLRPP